MGTTWGDGAPIRHRHDEYATREHTHNYFDDQGAELDELRTQLGEVIDVATELAQIVKEVCRDRDAIIRRMRLLEEALSLTPPAEFLTGHDEPPLPLDPPVIQGLPEPGQ